MVRTEAEEYTSVGDVLKKISSFISYLRRKWWLLILSALLGAALGVGWFLLQKPKYEAVTTFILEEKSPGGGSLAGLASQFGFDVGAVTGGGGIFAGDN